MFKRKIINELTAWKNSTGKKKALVIKGLRQIGKTYSVCAFAKENYENVIYINFKNDSSAKKVFAGDFNVDRITLDLSALMPKVRFVPYKTVLIFDEVQECSDARASIKEFMLDGRYDIICTGSLLGIKGYNKKPNRGVPTGFEHIVYMKPMDFEEFLWAKGINDDVLAELRRCYEEKVPVSESLHNSMLRYFKEYICVGGLPYVVDRFLSTNDMNVVYSEQKDIIEEYKDDFGKHLDENENEKIDLTLLSRINKVFDSIPAQLAKENKKFTYSLLEGNKIKDVFKIYMQDSGLFVAMLEEGSAWHILNGDFGIYKGAIYENIIADAFSKKSKPLYYYHKDSGLEIDFVTKYKEKATLIEVKASNGNIKSSKTVLKNKAQYNTDLCIKFGECNVGFTGEILTLPYYMAFMI